MNLKAPTDNMQSKLDSPRHSPSRQTDIFISAILALLWIALIMIVNPLGNFPLNDDWTYAKTVEKLVNQGTFYLCDWTGMSLVFQVLWGSLFCLPAGFSFVALRISTLVLGLVGILSVFWLLRRLGYPASMALLGALTLGLNPNYFSLSFTFMTDVPFLAFCILAAICFVNSLIRGSSRWAIMGTVLSCLAILIREVAIVIVAAYALAYLARNGLGARKLMNAFFPVAAVLVTLYTYQAILANTIGLPQMYNYKTRVIINLLTGGILQALRAFAIRMEQIAVYLGFFFLPFSVPLLYHHFGPRKRSSAMVVFIVWPLASLLIAIVLFGLDPREPLSWNTFFNLGLGTPTLRDVGLLHLPHYPHVPRSAWLALVTLSILNAGLLVSTIAAEMWYLLKRSGRRALAVIEPPEAFAFILCVIYICLILLTGIFDRYMIFLIPFMVVLLFGRGIGLGGGGTRVPVYTAVVALLVFASFDVAATHDYLSWNRARWRALDHLTGQMAVPKNKIDGGYEFNGWYLYDPKQPIEYGGKKSWWWVDEDDYIVAFGTLAEYDSLTTFPYDRWLPPGKGQIYILNRAEPDTVSAPVSVD
jgi:hypothetical protein